tara:strand:+ start:289 stop:513 length:225 start_codon:yes stop_codon:yes gene_type:complete
MKNNIFNIKGFRKSQKMISRDIAKNIIENMILPYHSDKNNEYFYTKNGKVRPWLSGYIAQYSKKKVFGQKGYAK